MENNPDYSIAIFFTRASASFTGGIHRIATVIAASAKI